MIFRCNISPIFYFPKCLFEEVICYFYQNCWFKDQATRVNLMATAEFLRELLDELDEANAECDGVTRLVSTVDRHFWVECGALRIDYRARMWLGDDDCVPHGVHSPDQYPLIAYAGKPVYMEPLSDPLFSIILNKDGYDFSEYFPEVRATSVNEPGSKSKGPGLG